MPLAVAFTDLVERTQPDAEVDHLPLQVWREDFHAERIAQRRGREMHEARELAGVCGQHVRLHRGHIAIAGEQFVRTVAHPGRPYAAFAEGAQSQILHSGVPQLHRVEAPQDGDHVGHGFEQRLVASPDNVVLETQSSRQFRGEAGSGTPSSQHTVTASGRTPPACASAAIALVSRPADSRIPSAGRPHTTLSRSCRSRAAAVTSAVGLTRLECKAGLSLNAPAQAGASLPGADSLATLDNCRTDCPPDPRTRVRRDVCLQIADARVLQALTGDTLRFR